MQSKGGIVVTDGTRATVAKLFGMFTQQARRELPAGGGGGPASRSALASASGLRLLSRGVHRREC